VNVPRANPAVILPALLAAALVSAAGVELDVAYVETPPEGVTLMLDLAAVGPGDYVIDLGTGDGRIAIAAAERGARAKGVDLDPQRIDEARANAAAAGVADRVEFVVEDLFETDLRDATVVTMFLNEEVNLRIRPALLARLAPGSRVVSHNFDMGDWQPARHVSFLHRSEGNVFLHDVFLWVIPGNPAQ
jgi:predicted O-methyltransferase YrrM